MSTKIYNGFRFTHRTITSIRRDLIALGEEVQETTKEAFSLLVHCAMVNIFDCRTVGIKSYFDKNDKAQPYFSAKDFFSDEIKEMRRTNRRNPYIDFDFEITVFPIGKRFLGMYFCESQLLLSLLTSKPWYREYHYQNNADRPEEISPKQWNKRRRDWDIALPGIGIPSQCGFTITLSDNYYPYTPIRFNKDLIPTLANRRKSIESALPPNKRCKSIKLKRIITRSDLYG